MPKFTIIGPINRAKLLSTLKMKVRNTHDLTEIRRPNVPYRLVNAIKTDATTFSLFDVIAKTNEILYATSYLIAMVKFTLSVIISEIFTVNVSITLALTIRMGQS